MAVHLSDAHYVTDASKYVSVLLLALRAMLQLELPHVNVLSKMDLITQYGDLPFNLEYYTEVQDLGYLMDSLDATGRGKEKFKKLNAAICDMVEDFGLVSFETLAVEDKRSMLKLLRLLDKVVGYAYIPPSISATAGASHSADGTASGVARSDPTSIPLQQLTGLGDVADVQERWVDQREAYDEWERADQARQGQARA